MKKIKSFIAYLLITTFIFSSVFSTNLKAATIADDDVNNRLRQIAIDGAGYTPFVFLNTLISVVWPTNEADIFELIKEQVQNLIDENIVDYIDNKANSNLTTINTYFDDYTNEENSMKYRVDKLEKAILLLDIVKDELINDYKTSYKRIIPLMATLATLHITALKALYTDGPSIYPGQNPQTWIEKMNKVYDEYISYIKKAYPQWIKWRTGLIDYKIYESCAYILNSVQCTHHGYVEDKYDDTTVFYQKNIYGSHNSLREPVMNAKMKTDLKAMSTMDESLNIFLNLHKSIPGKENEKIDLKFPCIPEGVYRFRNPYSGKNLDVNEHRDEDKAYVQIYQYTDYDVTAQRWRVTLTNDGWYEIIPECSSAKRRLDISNNEVTIYSYNGNDSQKWTFENLGKSQSDSYKIVSKLDDHLVINVMGTENHDAIRILSSADSYAQEWLLERVYDRD